MNELREHIRLLPRSIEHGARRIARQTSVVERPRAAGRQTEGAERLLVSMLESLGVQQQHLRSLKMEARDRGNGK
jgi:hypothetical protein